MQFFEETLLSRATLHTRQLTADTAKHWRSQGPQRLGSEQDKPLSPVSVQEHSSPPDWQGVCKKPTNKQVATDLIYISQQIKRRVLQAHTHPGWKEAPAHSFYQGMVI